MNKTYYDYEAFSEDLVPASRLLAQALGPLLWESGSCY